MLDRDIRKYVWVDSILSIPEHRLWLFDKRFNEKFFFSSFHKIR